MGTRSNNDVLNKQKKKILDEFTFLNSHELQSPLNTIISYLSLLKEEQKSMSDISQLSINTIDKAVIRMRNNMNALLNYVNIGVDRKIEKIDLQEIVSLTVDNLASIIEDKKANIKIELPSLIINADKKEMQSLIYNLIENALKFCKQETPPKIKIASITKKNEIVLSIQDNGIGIAQQDFEIIFDVFKRLNSYDDYSGSGIGLAVCKKIIDLYKGKIWLNSNLNEGCIFYLSVPKN